MGNDELIKLLQRKNRSRTEQIPEEVQSDQPVNLEINHYVDLSQGVAVNSFEGNNGEPINSREPTNSREPINPVLELLQRGQAAQKKNKRRRDKSKLYLSSEIRTIKLEGMLAENYTLALQKLGFEINLPEYTIDRGGFSPEAAKILGNAYLDEHLIIACPNQRDLRLIRNNYSFLNEAVDKIYKELSLTIQDITPKECLLFSIRNPIVEKGIQAYIEEEYPLTKDLSLSLEFDTTNDTIAAVNKLRQQIEAVKKDPDLILSKGTPKLFSTAKKYKEAIGYGNLAKLHLPKTQAIKYSVKAFKIENENLELYTFINSEPVFVYFNKGDKKLIDMNLINPEGYVILDGTDANTLINTLYDLQLIDYHSKTLLDRMEEIKDSSRNANESMVDALKDNGNKYPEFYYQLEAVVNKFATLETKQERDKYFKSLPDTIKFELVFPTPRRGKDMVYELLSKSMPQSFLRTYMRAEEDFKKQFSAKTLEQQTGMLNELTATMVYREQNNLYLNHWLNENHPEACALAQIKFETIKGE